MLGEYLNLEKIDLPYPDRLSNYPKAKDRAEWEKLTSEIVEYPVVEWTDEYKKTIGRLKLKTSSKSSKVEFVIKKA